MCLVRMSAEGSITAKREDARAVRGKEKIKVWSMCAVKFNTNLDFPPIEDTTVIDREQKLS
jgi:hypothetical protein